MIGFENAELVSYTLSRHVTMWGTLGPVEGPLMNHKYIAHMNTMVMLHASQIFSAVFDFCWQDENQMVQTDWTLFSKDRILQVCS